MKKMTYAIYAAKPFHLRSLRMMCGLLNKSTDHRNQIVRDVVAILRFEKHRMSPTTSPTIDQLLNLEQVRKLDKNRCSGISLLF